MRVQRKSTGEQFAIDSARLLQAGGEGRIFALKDRSGRPFAAKLYHRHSPAHARKLAAMLANPPDDPMAKKHHASIAWPQDLLLTTDGRQTVVGFAMPLIEGLHPIIEFYNPKARRERHPLSNYRYLIRTARNLAAAVHAVHARGYVIGDVNESNVLVSERALASLVDTDSFQVREPRTRQLYRCVVGRPEFTPAELRGVNFAKVDRTPEHDRFGLGVLLFQLLMEGTHPFVGRYTGPGDSPSIADCILAGAFPYAPGSSRHHQPRPGAPAFSHLNLGLQRLFVRCFVQGHREPAARPSAQMWRKALDRAERELRGCTVNDQHFFGSHLSACPWCARRDQLGGADPFASSQAVKSGRVTQTFSKRHPSPAAVRTGTPNPRAKPWRAKLTRLRAGLKSAVKFVFVWLFWIFWAGVALSALPKACSSF